MFLYQAYRENIFAASLLPYSIQNTAETVFNEKKEIGLNPPP